MTSEENFIEVSKVSKYTCSFLTGGNIRYKVEYVSDKFIVGSYSPIHTDTRYLCVHLRNGVNVNRNIDGITDLYISKVDAEAQAALNEYFESHPDIVRSNHTVTSFLEGYVAGKTYRTKVY